MSGGFNNMLHFVGVVEDIHDKTNAGRVRVRAFGIHPPRISEDVEDNVPTRDLPWATVLEALMVYRLLYLRLVTGSLVSLLMEEKHNSL